MFFPSGIIIHEHHKFLNTSRVRPLTPAVPSTERPMPFSAGRTQFPFLYKLLRNMFTEQGDDDGHDHGRHVPSIGASRGPPRRSPRGPGGIGTGSPHLSAKDSSAEVN